VRNLHDSPIIRRLPISAELRRTLRHSRIPCATFASLAMLARRGSLYFATTKSCTLKLPWRIVTSAAIFLRPAHSLRRPMALCCIVPVDLPQSCLMAWNFQEPDKCTRPRMVLAPRSQLSRAELLTSRAAARPGWTLQPRPYGLALFSASLWKLCCRRVDQRSQLVVPNQHCERVLHLSRDLA
jgi:hypothetical protein